MIEDPPISPQLVHRPPAAGECQVLGWASFFNDVASENFFPLLPQFLLSTLGGNRFYLGLIEGAVEPSSSFVKLWAGGWSIGRDRGRARGRRLCPGRRRSPAHRGPSPRPGSCWNPDWGSLR